MSEMNAKKEKYSAIFTKYFFRNIKILEPLSAVKGVIIFFLGVILALILDNKWNLPTGETVALILAAGAFVSSFYHFYAQRQHLKLSVKPYFQVSSSFDSITKADYYTFRVSLQNFGLGPGIVEEKTIKLGAIEINDMHNEFEEWVRLVNKITLSNGGTECRTSQCEPQYAIDKGATIELFLVNFPEKDMSFMDARDIAIELSRNIEVEIKYKSHNGDSYQCTKTT